MEFFDQLVIPPSANHIMLLKYILSIALLLFVPYLCMVIGATIISVYFHSKSKKPHNETEGTFYPRFAKDIIERLTITKNAEIALGIIPVLSITFAYAQLLYEAKTIAIGGLALSALLFTIGFLLIYRYRNAFKMKSVIDKAMSMIGHDVFKANPDETITQFEAGLNRTASISGKAGLILILLGAYVFAGSTSLASDPYKWVEIRNVLAILFSWSTFFSFSYLLAASGTITGSAILFYFFKWSGGMPGMDESYSNFVKRFGSGLAFFSAMSLPLLLFFNFLYLPQDAMSFSLFVYTLIALVVILISCNLLYFVFKNADLKFVPLIFVLVVLIFTFSIIKDQIALANSLKEQTVLITEKAEEHEKEKKSKVLSAGGLSGEDIYKTKCMSCHNLDKRIVGPAHKDVVPKYKGDVKKLIEFILNPQKVDPAFPPMPNPGLKPKEATAVAQYLIEKVGK